ncbi:unnamed protein product, partial [Effrenium voratum]
QALRLPPPCLYGARAAPGLVSAAHLVRTQAVLAMEEAEEMYFSDEGERAALLKDLRRNLEAVQAVQGVSPALQELQRKLLRFAGPSPHARSTRNSLQRSSSGAFAPAGSAAALVAARRRCASAPRQRP